MFPFDFTHNHDTRGTQIHRLESARLELRYSKILPEPVEFIDFLELQGVLNHQKKDFSPIFRFVLVHY